MKSDYYRYGFDAMINFDYPGAGGESGRLLANGAVWRQMAR